VGDEWNSAANYYYCYYCRELNLENILMPHWVVEIWGKQ